MKFSIIVPVYNVEKYIRKCLLSIISQPFQDYEIIVVDDQSPDNSIEIVEDLCKDYLDKIKVVRQKNKGLGGARNTGVEAAQGEYLVFLDSDDYLENNSLTILSNIVEQSQYDMVVFNAYEVSESGKVYKKLNLCGGLKGEIDKDQKEELLLLKPAAWNKIYRRDFFKSVSYFYPEHKWYEDTVITRLLFLKANTVYFEESYLYNYVQRDTSIVHSKISERMLHIIEMLRELIRVFRELDVYEKYYSEIEYICLKSCVFFVFELINLNRWDHEYQDVIINFVFEEFPRCSENKYLTKNEKEKMKLLCKRSYFLFFVRYGFKRKIKAEVKKWIPQWCLSILDNKA